jgi:hypothetical protein
LDVQSPENEVDALRDEPRGINANLSLEADRNQPERPERHYSSDESDNNEEYNSSDEVDVEFYNDDEYDDVNMENGNIDEEKYHAPVDGSHPEAAWAQAEANHTWFCSNRDVDWEDKTRNKSWPFPSYSHALLYFWLVAGGTPVTSSVFTQLLLLLQDPNFNPREDLRGVTDCRAFFRRAEKHLPMARPVSETVPRKTVVKRTTTRSGNRTGGGQVRVVKQFAMSTCKIDGLDIIDHVKRVYATPALRDKIRDQVYEDPGDAAPTQFNQTPFCKEPFKYMYLRTFFHRTAPDQELTEFRVDDVVKLRDSTVMRIDKLSYRAPNWQDRRSVTVAKEGGDVFPVLVITGPVFRPVREVHVCHVGTIVSHQASEVVKKLAVATGEHDTDDADIVCASEVTASGRPRLYTTRQTPLTFPGGGGELPVAGCVHRCNEHRDETCQKHGVHLSADLQRRQKHLRHPRYHLHLEASA